MDRNTLVKRDSSLFFTRVDDDLVLLSVEQGMYYGTQVVGRRIWTLIEEEISVSSLCEQLLEEFSVDRATCEREVLHFIEQLEKEGLVTVR